MLGGSSVVNDMKYTRGSKVDYDGWHSPGSLGSLDWKFDNLIEYFKHSENNGQFLMRLSNYLYFSKSLTVVIYNQFKFSKPVMNLSSFK